MKEATEQELFCIRGTQIKGFLHTDDGQEIMLFGNVTATPRTGFFMCTWRSPDVLQLHKFVEESPD